MCFGGRGGVRRKWLPSPWGACSMVSARWSKARNGRGSRGCSRHRIETRTETHTGRYVWRCEHTCPKHTYGGCACGERVCSSVDIIVADCFSTHRDGCIGRGMYDGDKFSEGCGEDTASDEHDAWPSSGPSSIHERQRAACYEQQQHLRRRWRRWWRWHIAPGGGE